MALHNRNGVGAGMLRIAIKSGNACAQEMVAEGRPMTSKKWGGTISKEPLVTARRTFHAHLVSTHCGML